MKPFLYSKTNLQKLITKAIGKPHSYLALGLSRGANSVLKRGLLHEIEEQLDAIDLKDFAIRVVIVKELQP